MIIAAAQTKPKQGNITENLRDHYRLVKRAAEEGANLILFPEMSITAYVREEADKLSFVPKDSRLTLLKNLAIEREIIIIAGAPIKIDNQLYIGSFIFHPDGFDTVYTKQFLHEGEEKFFSSSFDFNPLLIMGSEKISLATCFDIENRSHPENAKKAESSLYLASIFYLNSSMEHAHTLLSSYAKEYCMPVLMSNFCGECWDQLAGGKSAFWDSRGQLIQSLDAKTAGILILKKTDSEWSGKTLSF